MGNVTTVARRVHAIICIIMITGGQLLCQSSRFSRGGAGGVARVIFNRDSSYLEESNYKAPHNFKMGGPFTVIINEGVLPQTSGALFLQVSWL